MNADSDAERHARLWRLMDEIEAETTDRERAETRRVMDEMYDDRGLPVL